MAAPLMFSFFASRRIRSAMLHKPCIRPHWVKKCELKAIHNSVFSKKEDRGNMLMPRSRTSISVILPCQLPPRAILHCFFSTHGCGDISRHRLRRIPQGFWYKKFSVYSRQSWRNVVPHLLRPRPAHFVRLFGKFKDTGGINSAVPSNSRLCRE